MANLNGFLVLNIELSSRCNKSCFCCGRRKIEREYPHLAKWGDIDFELVEKIAEQLPDNIVVQFHDNGESLMYSRFGEAIKLFKNQIKCLDTNGKLLLQKADEIINNLDTLTISVIQDDDVQEGEEQYQIVKEFLEIKKDKNPFMIYRLLGNIDKDLEEKYKQLPGLIARRTLHSPIGSFDYKKSVTIPEIGICIDLLSHLIIDRYGNTYPCVRFNPYQYNLLGNIREKTLAQMWNGDIRKNLIREHIKGNRNCSPLCGKCEFYGVPTG